MESHRFTAWLSFIRFSGPQESTPAQSTESKTQDVVSTRSRYGITQCPPRPPTTDRIYSRHESNNSTHCRDLGASSVAC